MQMNFNKVIALNCSVTSSGLMALRQPALSHPFTELSLGVGSLIGLETSSAVVV